MRANGQSDFAPISASARSLLPKPPRAAIDFRDGTPDFPTHHFTFGELRSPDWQHAAVGSAVDCSRPVFSCYLQDMASGAEAEVARQFPFGTSSMSPESVQRFREKGHALTKNLQCVESFFTRHAVGRSDWRYAWVLVMMATKLEDRVGFLVASWRNLRSTAAQGTCKHSARCWVSKH
jgi:hypothetical protein